MEKSLLLRFDCSEILNNAVEDIFKRVAKFDMKRISEHISNTQELYSLVISTQGDYDLTIVLCASKSVFRKITENMKRNVPPGDAEIPIYVTEFYNILCGHIISNINKKYHCSARFAIPQFVEGHYITAKKETLLKRYFYDCGYGIVLLETLFY